MIFVYDIFCFDCYFWEFYNFCMTVLINNSKQYFLKINI